ncbi:hypothetical protein BpHYR1_031889 [Brachionus plicatilis]|uniref:Uncharacterized protein n=1 Tax=Brachionus plicatilis TaxID=10195 RepID=A0A3M7SU28_BRAPC|nr:hypothetical protein BpHYR1_031889 [Brachionus plicatilis]
MRRKFEINYNSNEQANSNESNQTFSKTTAPKITSPMTSLTSNASNYHLSDDALPINVTFESKENMKEKAKLILKAKPEKKRNIFNFTSQTANEPLTISIELQILDHILKINSTIKINYKFSLKP